MKERDFEALEPYLPGLKKEMPDSYRKLAEIIKCQALEVCWKNSQNGEKQTCIPYMMNDALECYLILENCRITGAYLPHCKEKTEAYLTEHNGSVGLVVKQGEDNVFTLWFEEITEHLACYQYHEIGHFWVQGMEQWRQLVYMIGTIYDKYEYLGEEVCTEKELELIPLMEFAPFRAWSPVGNSLEDWYTDTITGVETMKKMALLAGKNGAGVYQVIYRKVCEASNEYPRRDYGKEMNEKIKRQRKEMIHILEEKGFAGQYPCFRRGTMQVMAVEEHPFTIFEAEDFVFRIQFMVSVSSKENQILNFGFFKGRGNKGWIEKKIENL